MKVRELIEYLQTQDQDLEVIYSYRSEYTVLDKEDIELKLLQPKRADGHVADDWGSPELATVTYLVFPGN